MKAEDGVPVFSIDGRSVTDTALLGCLEFFPELSAEIQRARLSAGGADAGNLQEFIDNFRYQRELVAREDLDGWLAERKIPVEEFLEAMSRLHASAGTNGVGAPEALEQADSRVLSWCGSQFKVAVNLALRWLLFADQAVLDGAELGELMKKGKSRYREWVGTEISGKDLEALLHNRRLEFTRVNLTTVASQSQQVALEARLCWQEGIWQPEDFPRLAPVEIYHETIRMRDIDPVLRTQLLSRKPGDVLPPFETEEGWWVTRLESRQNPNLDDGDIRNELVELAVRPKLENLSKGRILWHVRP